VDREKSVLERGAVAKVGMKLLTLKIRLPCNSREVQGDLLWLGRAWVQKKDVMETEEALEHLF
jgi:hypothetical protein